MITTICVLAAAVIVISFGIFAVSLLAGGLFGLIKFIYNTLKENKHA